MVPMSNDQANDLPPLPDDLTQRIVESYLADNRTHHLGACFLPSRAKTIELIELLRRLIFPGFFDDQRLTTENVNAHVNTLLVQIRDLLYDQVHQSINYEQQTRGNASDKNDGDNNNDNNKGSGSSDDSDSPICNRRSTEVTIKLLELIPEIRRKLGTDVRAAFQGDPAAHNTDETVFCYPGLDAIFIHRVAHELYKMEVPLLPRIMSEYAHNETGVDIHPGATIGDSFFIDHGTGVVVGETSVIGDRVQIYQGVTLGALAPKDGERWRGRRRHPTIEDDVTIYPGATILGGETVIGAKCVVNGSVFITSSVPPGHIVGINHPELKLRARRPAAMR